MSEYTRKTEQMMYTETVWYKDGVEVQRDRNFDDYWYDTQNVESVSEDEWLDEFGEL